MDDAQIKAPKKTKNKTKEITWLRHGCLLGHNEEPDKNPTSLPLVDAAPCYLRGPSMSITMFHDAFSTIDESKVKKKSHFFRLYFDPLSEILPSFEGP